MADRELPSPELLRQLLAYNPDTGILTWLERPLEMFKVGPRQDASAKAWNARRAGQTASSIHRSLGYGYVRIMGRNMLAHRVIWAMSHGSWPEVEVDHINGVRSDNRIANLRSVSRVENTRNQAVRPANTSGVMGVSKTRTGRWYAYICIAAKTIPLGTYDVFDDAVNARKAAETRYGFHANHGRTAA